jgi:hypothetical protein
MELKERKMKKLRRTRRLGPKYTYRKGKKVKKDIHVLVHSGISDVVPDSYRNTSLKDNDSSPTINMKILPLIMHPWIQRPMIHMLIYQPL